MQLRNFKKILYLLWKKIKSNEFLISEKAELEKPYYSNTSRKRRIAERLNHNYRYPFAEIQFQFPPELAQKFHCCASCALECPQRCPVMS